MALAQRWSSDEHRGKTLAFIDVGSSLGIIASSTAVSAIISAYSWTAGWQSLGILTLMVAVMNLFLLKNPPGWRSADLQTDSPQTAVESVGKIYGGLIMDSKFWLIGVAYMLMAFSVLIPFTFLSTYAAQEQGFTSETAARLITVNGAGALVGKLVLGAISDKAGRIRIMMLCSLLVAAGCIGMAFAEGNVLFFFAAVFSPGFGAFWPMYAAVASDYFPKKNAGSIIGLWTVFIGVGSILSPVIAGWIADSSGTLSWSFVLASSGAVLSLMLLIPIWRRGK